MDRRICVDLGPASPFEGSWMTPGSDCLRVEPQCQLPTFHQSPVVLRPVANLYIGRCSRFCPSLSLSGGRALGMESEFCNNALQPHGFLLQLFAQVDGHLDVAGQVELPFDRR